MTLPLLDPDSFDFAHAHVIVPPVIRAGTFCVRVSSYALRRLAHPSLVR
jgi:hypothetical protein